jgi:hypothetical protein
MNTFQAAAFRRGRDRRNVVLKIEVDEGTYGHGPFLRRIVDPQPFAVSFELCFHRGAPKAEPRSGRMVKFEHLEPDVPTHVTTLRIHYGHGRYLELERNGRQRIVE